MTEHYFTKQPLSELRVHKIKVNINGKDYEFFTASGLFSLKKLDKASRLLINKSIINDKWKVLDLGCGYGIIGICLKILYPNIDLTMSDINKRAIMISKKNINKHNIKAKILQSAGFENINNKFDTILLNPPQAAGKSVCFSLIKNSKEHLTKDGILQVVGRHNKGGKTLSDYMKEIFGNVDDSVKKSGIRVYVSKNI